MKIQMKKEKIIITFRQIALFVLIMLSFGMKWCTTYFANISMNEIVFTLNMPLKGASNEYYYTFFIEVFVPTGIVYVLFLLICFWLKKVFQKYDLLFKFRFFKKQDSVRLSELLSWKTRKWLIFVLWLVLLIYIADNNYAIVDYFKSNIEASKLIENEYVDARKIKIDFPDKKKNLICIFIESAETTFQDKENGGVFDDNVIPEMTNIAKNNISFSQSELLEGAAVAPGTGWTIAGLVAQTSGMPLKIYSFGEGTRGPVNKMDEYKYFLPGAVSIGEILEQQGYNNYFMAGSDFSYGGRTEYFTQHGNYEIWDYYSAIKERKISEDYLVNWGFEDQKLYEYAKEKLLQLASEDEPFNFSMLTVDTHTGGGYVCELCPDKFDNPYANVWACASSQLADFLAWIEKQDFYEDTVIYISGDHSSMQGDFIEEYAYDKYNGEINRKVYNTFINSEVEPINRTNRKFTTLDMSPSILAALGAEIEGNRIGLGTNLFSDEQTLSEKYGYDELFEELGKKSIFYNQEILYPKD